jgi:hypothetical protein
MRKQDQNTPNQGDVVVKIHIKGVNDVYFFVSSTYSHGLRLLTPYLQR